MSILYFGCGANRDVRMIAAILGKPASKLKGTPAVLQDYELAVQRLDQVPIHARERLQTSWDKNFESYVIRPRPTGQVKGTIWELTKEERDRIRHWELIDFGWYEDCTAVAIIESGESIEVMSERLGPGQSIDRTVNGLDYPTWLNDVEKFETIASQDREEYSRK